MRVWVARGFRVVRSVGFGHGPEFMWRAAGPKPDEALPPNRPHAARVAACLVAPSASQGEQIGDR